MAGRGLTPKGGSDRKKLVLLLHLRMAFQPQQPPAAVEPRRVSLSCREHERLGGLHMCGTCAGYVCCQPDPRFLESSNARHLVAAACMRTGSECCGLQRWKEARVEPGWQRYLNLAPQRKHAVLPPASTASVTSTARAAATQRGAGDASNARRRSPRARRDSTLAESYRGSTLD